MSGKIPSEGVYKPRSALGDVTNQVAKREFSLISTSSGDDYMKAKKECQRVDNSKKENNTEVCVLQCKDGIACEIKESCPPGVGQNVTSPDASAVKAGDVAITTQLVHTISSDDPDVVIDAEDDEKTDSAAVLQIASKGIAEDNLGMDDDILDASKDGYLDCSRFPESQESKCGLERLQGDGFSSTCVDMIKACSCSFCTKAACIWLDLHDQDIKGRIAAIKKSQEEAAILVNQNSSDVATNLSNLESDLAARWKTLFLHMEDIFVREGIQLETSLSTLKELIDNCKTDPEKN